MNVVIALVIFIIGGISGFFANRLLSSTSQEQRKLAAQVNKSEAALDQYKLDVAEHLDSSAKLLDQMNDTCQTAMKQMQESTQLLQKATTVETEAITEAPLDYSGNPSGLFADQKQKVTTAV